MRILKVTINKPQCINHGCFRKVTHSGGKLRPFCGACHKANSGRGPYPQNVTPYKTGKCSNTDGHLGFDCPIDYTVSWAQGMTEIDHIDGDDTNNAPENIQEVCPMCHRRKGVDNGDYARQRTNKMQEPKIINTSIFE